MPCHHDLEDYLHAYLLAAQPGGTTCLFGAATGRSATLSGRPMSQSDVCRMIGRRAGLAGIKTRIGCHTSRATGITEYLRNGRKLKSRRPWPIMKAPARPGFTTGATISCCS